jgi:hypothetical protein
MRSPLLQGVDDVALWFFSTGFVCSRTIGRHRGAIPILLPALWGVIGKQNGLWSLPTGHDDRLIYRVGDYPNIA